MFHEDNENGVVQEVLLYCTRDLTLEISLGTNIDSMKISDAYNYRLLYPNTSFWLARYDTSNNRFCLVYQPFNMQPYRGSVTVSLKNEGSDDATATKVILKRIRAKIPPKSNSAQEFGPVAVEPEDHP